MRPLITAAIAVAVVAAAGFYVYDHLKEKPPSWLIGLVTKTDPPPPLPSGDLAPLTVPEGFTATIYARDIAGARDITRDQKGTMLVSQTKDGKVVALPDLNSDGKSDRTVTVLEGLTQPHGILVRCEETGNESADQDSCLLYVAETGVLKAYQYDADTYTARMVKTVAMFPTGDGHYTRTLLMHPDGERLLVSVGSSCNVCNEEEEMRATVQAITLLDNTIATFAKGLRNTVFMAVHPVTGEVWGTDNGRDVIGDDIPPDEVNIIREGNDYGWPICYGKNIHDTDFDNRQYIRDPCADEIPSHIDLQAHSAALGLGFVPEEGWPEDMWHDVVVAYHGSWNRSEPTGYKVVRFDLDSRGAVVGGPIDLMTGFLPAGSTDTDDAIGRPVDVYLEPGGVMYVSDDRAGAIYRVALNEPPR
jgi:glucose/arabinose dehydrogenase